MDERLLKINTVQMVKVSSLYIMSEKNIWTFGIDLSNLF